MRPGWSLTRKLAGTGLTFLVLALISIGLTLWVTWNLEGGAAAVNEAGRLRMQTWRLAASLHNPVDAALVGSRVAEFDASLRLLRQGDPSRPLFLPREAGVDERFNEVERLWAEQRPQWVNRPSATSFGTPFGGARELSAHQAAEDLVHAVDALVGAIERQMSQQTAFLNLFQMGMVALALLGAAAMLYTGYLYVISPLDHLQRGLARIEAGDFKAQVEVDSLDEFGRVAAGFNQMAQTLGSLYEGLEAKVVAKTQAIETQRARLAALYDVSAFLAETGSVREMAQGFAKRVRAFTRADAATVRWADADEARFLMLATDCFPHELAESERSLPGHTCGCGSPPPDARARVIPIRSLDNPAHHGDNPCLRHGYEHLVAVPIRLQQRVLGELNLFFRDEVRLSADEMGLLDALASHLASALEGQRAAALEREAAVGEERALLARELHDSIAQSLAFLKIQVQLLRTAMQRGQAERVQTVLDELDAGLRESVGDVRELLVHFRTRTNTEDIEPALQETLQKFQHQTGLPTHLEVAGSGLPLPADIQVQVLHVVQEALSNVRKHAAASHVSVEVHKDARWRVVVRDNGSGFDTAQNRGESHVGLKIMRERAQRIGADVMIHSSPGAGTAVVLTLPDAQSLPASGSVARAGLELAL